MSSFAVLSATSKVLKKLLWDGISQVPALGTVVPVPAGIVFSNPFEARRDSANVLSFWLYQLTENEYVKNQTPARSGNGQALLETPLAVNLHFLVTPCLADPDSNLLLLGEVMQVLYDNAIVVVRDTANDVFEELRITMCRLTLEELTRIWEALIEPYRLSVCYEVRVTHIDSRRVADTARVIDITQVLTDEMEEVTA